MESKTYSKINHIIGTNLYISDYNGVSDLDQLNMYNIKHVFNTCASKLDEFPNIIYSNIIMSDDSGFDISQFFGELFTNFDKIISNGENLVVNCQAGMSRSASVLIGYLIYKGSTFEDSYNLLKSCRNIIKPNQGFTAQLKKYEIDLRR
jgi:protein-tyrosine phosphatase